MIDYATIIIRKYPNAHCYINGDDYEGLVWLGDDSKPTKEELDNLWPIVGVEIQTEAEAKAAQKAALLERLGITADEAKLLLA